MKSGSLFCGLSRFLSCLFSDFQAFGSWHDEWSGYDASFSISDGVCNIAVVPILGEIIPYSGANDYGDESEPPISISAGDARAAIRMAESDPDIRGVLVYIDSYGGTPAAAESIANMLKGSPMPVAAYIGEAAASSRISRCNRRG